MKLGVGRRPRLEHPLRVQQSYLDRIERVQSLLLGRHIPGSIFGLILDASHLSLELPLRKAVYGDMHRLIESDVILSTCDRVDDRPNLKYTHPISQTSHRTQAHRIEKGDG